jgi:hypothetical protein
VDKCYGCMKRGCYHETLAEAVAHIVLQRREWWDGLSVEGKAKVAKMRNRMDARYAFENLTTEKGKRVQ